MKEGFMSGLRRKAAPYLLASTISFPIACSRDITSPKYEEPVQTVEQFSQKYEPLIQSGNYSLEKMLSEAEAIAPYDNVKQKAVSLAQLASEIRPDGDVNHDSKENIFDLIYLLGKLGNNEDCDINKDGKTDIFDLISVLKVLGGYYDNPPGINATYNGKSINAADSLNAYNKALIQLSYSGNLDSSFVNVNEERKGDLRNIDLSPGLYKFGIKAFGNEKESSLDFIVNVAEQSVTTKTIPSISFNEDEVSLNVIDADDYFNADGVTISNYTAEGFNNINVSVNADGKVSVSNKTKDFNGTEAGKLRVHFGAEYADNNLAVIVNAMDDLRGQHIDNDSEQGVKAKLAIDTVVYETDSAGNFDVQRNPGSHTVKARQADGNGNNIGYIRTETINGENTNLNLFSVSYPTQEGVSPELFKAFCDEAMAVHGGSNGFGEYYGLKTGLKNPKNRFWISSHGDSATYSVGGKATAEEQAYVKSLIENVIYPHLRPEYRFPIYVEDSNAPETIPAFQDGSIVIVPRNSGGFGAVSVDDNHDGVADWSIIFFPNWGWNQTEKGPIIEEALSALVGMGEVSHYFNLTALESNKTGTITQIDDKLINIQHRYKPKEDIENILGMR